jgi:hypothetical protein
MPLALQNNLSALNPYFTGYVFSPTFIKFVSIVV